LPPPPLSARVLAWTGWMHRPRRRTRTSRVSCSISMYVLAPSVPARECQKQQQRQRRGQQQRPLHSSSASARPHEMHRPRRRTRTSRVSCSMSTYVLAHKRAPSVPAREGQKQQQRQRRGQQQRPLHSSGAAARPHERQRRATPRTMWPQQPRVSAGHSLALSLAQLQHEILACCLSPRIHPGLMWLQMWRPQTGQGAHWEYPTRTKSYSSAPRSADTSSLGENLSNAPSPTHPTSPMSSDTVLVWQVHRMGGPRHPLPAVSGAAGAGSVRAGDLPLWHLRRTAGCDHVSRSAARVAGLARRTHWIAPYQPASGRACSPAVMMMN
jgi:hypothetical protein